jgi:hypothetical protein
MTQLVDDVLGEAVDEASGASSKRWALLLLALLTAAAVPVWLRRRRAGSTSGQALEPAADTSENAESTARA